MQDAIRNSIKAKMLAAGPNRAVFTTPEEFNYLLNNGTDAIIAEVETLEKQNAAMQQGAVAGIQADQQKVNADRATSPVNTEEKICPDCAKLDAELNKLLQPVMAFMRRECNPHSKIILDGDAAEIVSGEKMILAEETEPAFNPTVTKENLKIGDRVTVKEWTSHKDNSYKGEHLEVMYAAWPHVFVDRHSEYGHKSEPLRLNTDRLILERLSPDYIEGFNWQLQKNTAKKVA